MCTKPRYPRLEQIEPELAKLSENGAPLFDPLPPQFGISDGFDRHCIGKLH